MIDCGFPEFLENGFVTHSDTLYGAEASYWCRRGFRLINGDSSQKCTRAGVWSGRKPICKGFHSSIYILVLASHFFKRYPMKMFSKDLMHSQPTCYHIFQNDQVTTNKMVQEKTPLPSTVVNTFPHGAFCFVLAKKITF